MFSRRRMTWTRLATLAAAGVAAPLLMSPSASADVASHATTHTVAVAQAKVKPTIVLVHGAFTNSAGWDGVVQRLQHDGYKVVAPEVPMRDLGGDASYLDSFLATIKGPVVLAGHSYGGAVITNAGNKAPNVKGLVYVAGYAPAQGESILALSAHKVAHPAPPLPVQFLPYNAGNGQTGLDVYLNPAKYRDAFLSDTVSAPTAAVLAATQEPVSAAALNEVTGNPAWKTLPSWYIVAKKDNAIGTDLEKFMAARIGAHTTEVPTSHDVMLNDPAAVTRVIEQAALSTGK